MQSLKTEKKDILKKYMGKGGPSVKDVIREIPGTLRGMNSNLSKAVNPGNISVVRGIKKAVNWVGGQVEKDMRMDDNKEGALPNPKKGLMQKAVKKAIPMPTKIPLEKILPKSTPSQGLRKIPAYPERAKDLLPMKERMPKRLPTEMPLKKMPKSMPVPASPDIVKPVKFKNRAARPSDY